MKNIFGRNLIKRSDVFVIFLTLLLIFSSFFLLCSSSQKNTIAVITIDGSVHREIDLALQEDCIITLETQPVVTLEIKNGQIRFINSRCPDSTCEKMGFLSEAGDTAACLPAKTVVTIKGTANSSGIDAVAG